jgi:hypothetical protein
MAPFTAIVAQLIDCLPCGFDGTSRVANQLQLHFARDGSVNAGPVWLLLDSKTAPAAMAGVTAFPHAGLGG